MSWWNLKNKEIDLVLSSSGVRAPCFIGAIEGLEEQGYTIKRIAGSSGGAIIAAGYALGMSTAEMRRMAVKTPYKSFFDFSILNLLSLVNPSVYTGQELDRFYQNTFGNAMIKDFQMDCKISVVTIVNRKRIVIDKDSHPDLPVWKAVRMSSTIPFIFPYYTLEGVPVTDGGLVTSLLDIFIDSPRPIIGLKPRATIIKLSNDDSPEPGSKLFLWTYLKILAEFVIDTLDNQHVPQVERFRTIVIPTFGIKGFSIHLKEKDVETLIQCGRDAVFKSELNL